MIDALAALYPWIKALHIIAVIAWMAGMLYLPRLYVYHCDTVPGSTDSERFKVMERRLLRGIINPSMVASLLLGLVLAGIPGLVDWGSGWIYVKLAGVLGLVGLHGACSRWRRDFEADRNRHTPRFYRIVNEVPAVIMVVVVVMVVVKPF